MYVATINVPGYLPMDDDPPEFDTVREAWDWLLEEHERGGEGFDVAPDPMIVAEFEAMTGTGTLYTPTPGYDGDHDLGLAYSVQETS